ncbi:DUF2017 family protein [Sanguibacter sp. A247]|uniref:DUF2017 family protein n=1 Tax=unclassified Sanguibacter TaxID=2645534 RepID=UPI003FD85EBE
MRPFEEVDGRFVARLTRDERFAIAQVAEQIVELLEQEIDGLEEIAAAVADDAIPAALLGLGEARVEAPSDPAVRRLLPNAAPTDPGVGEEFRRLTQTDLALSKAARLTSLCEALVGVDEPLLDLGAHDDAATVDAQVVGGAFDDDPEPDDELLGAREIAVEPADARSFAGALTDVRLVLAERLGLATDADSDRLSTAVEAAWRGEVELDPRVELLGSVFLLAGYLQESLLDLMLARLRGTAPGL